jgi:hypothetical protein
MGINDTAVFQVDQGTSGSGNFAGTVTVSGTSSFAINVNTTGFTFKNVSTSNNNYLGATNGITLGNGVNLNLSSMPVTSSGTGSLGLRMSGIKAAAGTTGQSITIVGDTGSTAPVNGVGGSGVRILTDKSSAAGASSTNIISVNTIIATTGSQAAYFSVSSGTSLRFEGTVTINSGSRLVLSPGASTTRTIDVRGNIISFEDGALSIGESSNTGTTLLSGNNTLTGDLNVYGILGYGSKTALGTSRVVLNQGSTLAQSKAIGSTDADRAIANNILLNGTAWAANTFVTFGGLSNGNVFNGGVDMGGLSRVLKIDNSTTFNGAISNSGGGGLVLTNSAGSVGGRTLEMFGASTYTGGTTLKSSGTGWKVITGNTSGSAFGTGNVNFDGTGATARSLLAGTGIIAGTVGGYVQATAGSSSTLGGGLLTVGQLDTSTASALSTMTFAFEATSTALLTGGGNYNNDVIRATSTAGSPFTQALASGNIIDIYLNAGSLGVYNAGNAGVFQTGFFSASDFSLGSGTFNLFVQDAGGTTTFNSATYQTWAQYMAASGTALGQSYTLSTTSATLASGDTGFISTVTIIPEPSTGAMLVFGLVGLVGVRALRRKA